MAVRLQRRWSWSGLGLATLAAALWGLAPVATKGALAACSPDLVSTIRLAVSAVVFRICAGRDGKWLVREPWVWLAGVALGVDFVLYSHGMRYSAASVAGLLVNVEPVATIVLAVWLLGERLNRHRIIGSILTLGGVLVVSSEGVLWDEVVHSERRLGNALVMASALCWSVYAVAQRRSNLGPTLFHRLTAVFSVATLTSLPQMLLPGALMVRADAVGWLMLAVVTVLCTSFVYLVYARAQQLVEISALAVLLSTIPIFSLAFAALILGEPMTRLLLIGASLVMSGVLVIALEKHPVHATAAEPH